MKRIIMIAIATALLLGGCAPAAVPTDNTAQTTDSETADTAQTATDADTAGDTQNDTDQAQEQTQDQAHGQLEDGERVIALESGYGQHDIIVYRGETVRFVFSSEGHVSIALPDFEEEAEGDGEASVTVKAGETGTYAITTCIGDLCEMGSFRVAEFVVENRYFKVDAATFESQMNGNYVLLDVRTQAEYDEGHIEGSVLIPLNELAGRLDEVAQYDKALVYCRSGNRSVTASEILINAGFPLVYDLSGGIGAWDAYKSE